VAILKPNERIQSRFLEKCLQSRFLQLQIRTNTSQLAQGNLFQGAIQKLRVPLPPKNEQNRFVELVESLDSAENHLSHHAVNMCSLKKVLLNQLTTETK